MRKYYLHDGAGQQGPFDIDGLRQKEIQRTTPVWYEGLAEWQPAQTIPELQPLFTVQSPPPFSPPPVQHQVPQNGYNAVHTPKKKSHTGLIISLVAVIVILAAAAIVIVNNPNAVPGVSVEINTPKPSVITSRADGDGSGLLNARTTVYATVMNQGGDGNVLVNFYVYQGNNTYDRTESIYMSAGASQDLEVTFDEVDYVSGEITYYVDASAR